MLWLLGTLLALAALGVLFVLGNIALSFLLIGLMPVAEGLASITRGVMAVARRLRQRAQAWSAGRP